MAEVAQELAAHWKVNTEAAYLAGIVHDVAKPLTPHQLPVLHRLYEDFPPIWHSFAAPYLLRKEFQIKNAAVLSAVRWHTTGREKMARLSQILYVADFVEPGRSISFAPDLLKLAYRNLDGATFGATLACLQHLLKKGQRIHSYSWRCYDYYYDQLSSKDRAQITQLVSQ